MKYDSSQRHSDDPDRQAERHDSGQKPSTPDGSRGKGPEFVEERHSPVLRTLLDWYRLEKRIPVPPRSKR